MKRILITLLILLSLCTNSIAAETYQNTVLRMAHKYYMLKIVEKTGNNDHPIIDTWLKRAGTIPKQPYCMAFVYSCYDEAAILHKIKNPLPKTAKVSTFWNYVKNNPYKFRVIGVQTAAIYGNVNNADIVVWKRGTNKTTWPGHAGLSLYNTKQSTLYTIEANTGADPRDGVGAAVLYKERTYSTNINFGMQGLVRLR